MAQRTIGIALLGCGVVGGGVAHLLIDRRELIARRSGVSFDIRHVVVRDLKKRRKLAEGTVLSSDAHAAIDDPKVEIVVELAGGIEPAGKWIERALTLGKPVVTANKSLLAARGHELVALARKHDTCIAFEASCGGGIPVIQALMHGLIANDITALVGIVNGTCNVILTRMTRNGWPYQQALEEAQKAGFAEADPTLDVSGRDAAQKLALLAGLAFNARFAEQDIHVEGIDTLQEAEFRFARELGYVIKLLAIAERVQGSGFRVQGSGGSALNPEPRTLNPPAEPRSPTSVCLRVHPTLVHQDDLLADVSGSFNAISLYGHALGHVLFYGRGAGEMPTASAVVADIVNTAMGLVPLAFKQLPIFPDASPPVQLVSFHDLQSRYYLRLMAKDEPGVLAQVTRILGEKRISLSAIMQHETNGGQFVPVVITTHQAREGAIQGALKEINALPTIASPAVCLRIIDPPKEFAGS